MKSSDFFGKLTSKYIWLNLAAMAAVVVLQVGNGSRSETDTTIDYVEPNYKNQQEDQEGEGDVDEFDVVTPAETPQRGN